ncbi:YuzD family protein [Sporosarcina ureilytica]|uniref:Disulfide oxidoreductase n=1 Tax=Sporosarcina ureilytica TaxID=298596 RepID=A0A1D8JE47_9BACL|nr:YuzD family protein [Sporosarcina ureilytica]AOV06984.1 disulfide oxidoreductase [Sporosarcina ureilytica]
MVKKNAVIEIFGADVVCASCVNAPSSKDTFEWLQAAISRKYPEQPFTIEYIDIDSTLSNKRHEEIAEQIQNDEYFYPLVMINEEMIGEGHIQLKPVFASLEKLGYVAEAK